MNTPRLDGARPLGEYHFPDDATLVPALARRIGGALRRAIVARGTASLVVSGGRTPGPLFTALSEIPLPWDRVQVTLADERWVPATHNDSNEGLVRRCLLRRRAAAAEMIGLVSGHATAADGVDTIAERLRRMPRPFDVVILGLGTDGHTASLFPGAAQLAAGLDHATTSPCLAIRPPNAPHERISLTAAALLDSRWRILHLRGDEKWRVLRRALDGLSTAAAAEDPTVLADMPVRSLLRGGLDIYWSP